MEGINRLTQGRTTFIIAHRLSTVRSANMILVLRDGKIAESGSFDELMRRGGVFSGLYNTQFVDSPTPESRIATSVQPS
jgi:ABC-type multidrug transport system fused ATPase/permease subunit